MTGPIEIRHALEADASGIAELILSTSLACCFTPKQPCPKWYEESLQPQPIADLIRSARMEWLVATQEGRIAGILAIRDKSQVKYFFVDPSRQKLGIGQQLWELASRGGMLGHSLMVRSSLSAVSVYERLGFIAIEPPGIFNGLHYQTMEANLG